MRKVLGAVAAVLVLASVSAFAETEAEVRARLKSLQPKDYPVQTIEFVVVYPAGGGMDTTARLLAKYVEKHTDHRVIVVNKTGGSGLIGHTYLATQAKNDGYTVGIVANGAWSDAMLKGQGKWSHKDLPPISFINYDPVTWLVSTEGPFKDKSIADVVAAIKAKPGTVKVAVVPGLSFEFLAEQIEGLTGSKVIKVPFQGGAPGVTALLGGHVDIATGFLAEYRGHLDAGKVKVLAVAGEERSPNLPNVPTFNEALGLKTIVWSAWRFAVLPKGVAPERRRYLEAALDAALRDPELVAEYKKTGAIVERKLTTAAQIEAEVEKLARLERDFFVNTGRLPK